MVNNIQNFISNNYNININILKGVDKIKSDRDYFFYNLSIYQSINNQCIFNIYLLFADTFNLIIYFNNNGFLNEQLKIFINTMCFPYNKVTGCLFVCVTEGSRLPLN